MAQLGFVLKIMGVLDHQIRCPVHWVPSNENLLKKMWGLSRYTVLFFLALSSVHCSWTPKVETSIHESPRGSIALQTTDSFEQSPSHPITLSSGLLQRAFAGIRKSQEQGVVQDFIMGSAQEIPAFSASQIDFLVPHIAFALSQATSEEYVVFKCSPGVDQGTPLRGTVAVFAPSTIIVTLNKDPRSVTKTKKQTNPSGFFQGYHVLHFSPKHAVVSNDIAQQLMNVPSSSGWIAINLDQLEKEDLGIAGFPPKKSSLPTSSVPPSDQNSGSQSLQEQLQELRQKIEEQDKEIQRLKDPAP